VSRITTDHSSIAQYIYSGRLSLSCQCLDQGPVNDYKAILVAAEPGLDEPLHKVCLEYLNSCERDRAKDLVGWFEWAKW